MKTYLVLIQAPCGPRCTKSNYVRLIVVPSAETQEDAEAQALVACSNGKDHSSYEVLNTTEATEAVAVR